MTGDKELVKDLTRTFWRYLLDRKLYLNPPRKILNSWLTTQNHRSRRSRVSNYPLSLFVEPTNTCNLRCPSCPTGNETCDREKGYMDPQLFRRLMDELGSHLFELFFWNFGEPTLHPHCAEMISYAKRRNIYIQMDTNGTRLNDPDLCQRLIESRLDRITVSLDGARSDSYRLFRGRDCFEAICEGIRTLHALKKKRRRTKPWIEVQFILMRHNESEIEAIQDLSRKLGADELTLRYFIFRQYDRSLLSDLWHRFKPENGDCRIFDMKHGEIRYRRPVDPSCYMAYSTSCILWNGDVVPCCYDAYSKVPLGNIRNRSFMDTWNGAPYRDLRSRVNQRKADMDLCKECNSMEMWVYKKIYF